MEDRRKGEEAHMDRLTDAEMACFLEGKTDETNMEIQRDRHTAMPGTIASTRSKRLISNFPACQCHVLAVFV